MTITVSPLPKVAESKPVPKIRLGFYRYECEDPYVEWKEYNNATELVEDKELKDLASQEYKGGKFLQLRIMKLNEFCSRDNLVAYYKSDSVVEHGRIVAAIDDKESLDILRQMFPG